MWNYLDWRKINIKEALESHFPDSQENFSNCFNFGIDIIGLNIISLQQITYLNLIGTGNDGDVDYLEFEAELEMEFEISFRNTDVGALPEEDIEELTRGETDDEKQRMYETRPVLTLCKLMDDKSVEIKPI